MTTSTDDAPTLGAMTPADELKSLAVIVKRAEKLSTASRRWLVAHLEAEQTNGDKA